MNIGMCACGGIYCKYCGDPYRASPYQYETTATGTNIQLPQSPDHGISPAQPSERALVMLERATSAARAEANHHAIRELREKVEDVNQHLGSLAAMVSSLTVKLDAALKRIDDLERRSTS